MNLDKSVYNITTTPLLAGEEWLGEWEFMDKGDIQINAFADKTCRLYLQTKPFKDEVFYSEFPPTGYELNGITPLYRVPQVGRRYCRVRLVNTSGEDCTVTWVHTSFGFLRQPNAPLNTSVALDADASIVRSVSMGQKPDGTYANTPALYDGSMKVGITNPLTAFGELLTASNHPVLQGNAVYGLTGKMRVSASGAGAVAGAAANDFYATSGTGSTAVATVFTQQAAVYKSGQGLSFMFTARYSTPQPNSVMWAGAQNATDAIVIGYLGTVFGVFLRHWGQQEIRELTFTVGSGGSTNATVTLNGTAYTVPLTAGTTAQNAREAAASLTSQTTLWTFTQVGSRVICRYIAPAVIAGAFSFTHATAVAAFSQTAVGVAVTEDFVPSASFSQGDALDWLDPTKGNVFRVDVQFLGYGDIDIYVEFPDPKESVLLHRFHYANENVRTSLTNPSFRVGWTAGNRGNTTPVSCYGGSYSAFIQGEMVYHETAKSFTYTKSSAVEIPLFAFKVSDVFGGKVNVSSSTLMSVGVLTDSTKGATFRLIKNPVLTGATNYAYLLQNESLILVDAGATGYTGGTIIDTFIVGSNGGDRFNLSNDHLHFNPNDIILITGQVISGASSALTAAMTMVDDL